MTNTETVELPELTEHQGFMFARNDAARRSALLRCSWSELEAMLELARESRRNYERGSFEHGLVRGYIRLITETMESI